MHDRIAQAAQQDAAATNTEQSVCATLRACLSAGPAGEFEALAITSGEGNGWSFSPQTLRASLALWEGAQVFIDHAPGSRSLRDLAGGCADPAWDEAAQGIRVRLRALGPSGTLLAELGRQMLNGPEPRPQVGFSADLVFTARQREVQRIVRINSLDLVFNPARGGAFVRAFQSKEEFHMADEQISESMQETKAAANSYLLELGLQAARLPRPAENFVRAQLEGRDFSPQELTRSIDEARKLVSDLTGAAAAQGPVRISGMYDSRDQLQAAVDDLFEVPRDKGLENLKAARLQGVRELYLMLTGDYDFHGGYRRERAQLANCADFTGLVKNALNKIVVNTWEMLGRAGYDWWRSIATVEHFNTLNQVTGTLVGTVGDLPSVNEGGAYTELVVGDSPETASFTKYGGYVPLTLELIDRDETRKLKAYARELSSAGLRKISSLVAGIFTQSGGVGPTLADGGALFNATAVTTAGGHANLRTVALSANEWDSVGQAVYNQRMLIKNAAGSYGVGPRLAISPRYCLVPRALQLTAKQILYPQMERAANIFAENMQRGEPGDVITVPEWTDVTDWAAVCDPRVAPAIYIGERFGILPEVFIAGDELSPAVFTNDEHRLKVRHFLAVWVNDFRPIAKNNVAG